MNRYSTNHIPKIKSPLAQKTLHCGYISRAVIALRSYVEWTCTLVRKHICYKPTHKTSAQEFLFYELDVPHQSFLTNLMKAVTMGRGIKSKTGQHWPGVILNELDWNVQKWQFNLTADLMTSHDQAHYARSILCLLLRLVSWPSVTCLIMESFGDLSNCLRKLFITISLVL